MALRIIIAQFFLKFFHNLWSFAFVLFVVGFGFIYSTGSIKYKGVAYGIEMPIGVLLLIAGWALEHTAVQLEDFGHLL